MEFSKETYRNILESIHDGLYILDKNRKIVFWNKAAEQITGFKSEEVKGSSCSDNILTHVDENGNNLCRGLCPLAETMGDDKPRSTEVFLHHKEGHRVPVSVRVNTVKDKNGEIIGGVEVFSDVSNNTANRLRILELEKLALLDSLTQLANRNYISRELQSRFEEKKRFGIQFGLLFMDIDHFKKINDKYGHSAGDKILKFVSKSLSSNARPFDIYGRWGGEEFIGIVRNIDKKALFLLGNRMRMLIENSYVIINREKLNVTVSVGATLVKDDDTAETLIHRADVLMYKSKRSGRNRITQD